MINGTSNSAICIYLRFLKDVRIVYGLFNLLNIRRMVTLQDISFRLLKPIKELADWSFPLSQILEEYYALLEDPCDLNFGEAALVLQNSADVYVRRIDYLFDDAMCLNQAFINYESEEAIRSEEAAKLKSEKRSKDKVHVDLNNFKILNLNKEVGKSINTKSRPNIQKTINLISKRFTQLENHTADLHVPIDIFDVHGDIIGKKYDFRCNQQLSKSGMLVDELSPDEFQYNLSVKEKSMSLLHAETCIEISASPDYGFDKYYKDSTDANEFNDCTEEHDSNYGSLNPSLEVSPTESTMLELNCNRNFLNSSMDISVNEGSTILVMNNEDGYNDNEDNNVHNHAINANEQTDVFEKNSIDANMNDLDVLNDNLDGDSGYLSGSPQESFHIPKRRSQRLKSMTCIITGIHETTSNPSEPTCGVSNVIRNNIADFKVPCRTSTLKTKVDTKRRKSVSKQRKRRYAGKLLLNDSKSLQKCSPTKSPFSSSDNDEFEKFEGAFDDYLRNKALHICHYKAVTNTAMELLGYQPYTANENSIPKNSVDFDSWSSSPCDTMLEYTSLDEGYSQRDTTSALLDYQRCIADRMKEIFKESDVTTELENSVAKWHQHLQPKLLETKKRSLFCIRDYASNIIKSLKTIGREDVSFDSIVEGQPTYEVARYFLATLQLANTYNVDINVNQSNDNDIGLTLLDKSPKIDV